MSQYSYVARNREGKKVTGAEDALSKDDLVSRLQSREMIVVNVVPLMEDQRSDAVGSSSEDRIQRIKKRRHNRIKSNDMVLLCRQLATLLGAGITILQSIRIISRQVASNKLDAVLGNLAEDMERGLSLHEAMARHPNVFSDLWINLVESGEASGNLAVVLGRLATYLERSAEFQRKIISSLIYPMILLAIAIVALLFLTIKIIPTFANLFTGFDMELPMLTKVLINVSLAVRDYFFVAVVFIVVAIFIFRQYLKIKEGRKKVEKMLFTMPVFGEFYRALVVERFSSGMATLVESGVPILYALEITERSVGNLVIADIIRKVKDDVREGKSLSRPLERSGFFEPMVVQMVAIGEEIGELSPMLKRINYFYQQYADTFLLRFTAMFEPLMLIFLGALIGIMVIGMFLPIFQITQLR